MQVSYVRNVKGSFMIVEGSGEAAAYEEQMLRENQVMVLLSFFTLCMDRKIQYWYEITGKTSFRDYVEQEGLSADLIRKFFTRLKTAFDRMSRYLIDPDHILLNPDTIFLERVPADFRIFLTYNPLDKGDVPSGIVTVTEFLTEQIEKGDSDVTDLCFRLYDASLKETDAFDAVLAVLKAFAPEEVPGKSRAPVLLPEEADYIPPVGREEPVRKSSGWHFGRDRREEVYEDNEEDRKGSRRFGRDRRDEVYEDDGEEYQEETVSPSRGNSSRRTEDSSWEEARRPSEAEEDPWGTGDEDDNEYEEAGGSLLNQLFSVFTDLFDSVFSRTKKKALNLFPVNRDEPDSLDFEYDADDTLDQPTILLSRSASPQSRATEECGGKLLYEGTDGEKDYVLSKEVFRIGSQDDGNDAVLHSSVVSRHHARISKTNGDYFLEDLNSKNGTFVNGKMLSYRENVKLKRMDVITFADVVYRFV
ncbi:MAG: DUF6382 domain-containing protein [Lachnospiraceae bacterium]|nr:DUF6382 domain-containing protein [Lachnospiraceae bacterium]